MPSLTEQQRLWDGLYDRPRFRPLYPEPEVVRFMMRHFGGEPMHDRWFIDIGAGAGRHARFISELGGRVLATDLSRPGLVHALARLESDRRSPLGVVQASMDTLPVGDGTVDGAISWGSFYYGTAHTMRRAIAELHRVLKPGGKALVALRTTDDYRCGKGERIGDEQTFRLTIDDTNEHGMTVHFVSERAVPDYFAPFSSVEFERVETTFNARAARNSDWIVIAGK